MGLALFSAFQWILYIFFAAKYYLYISHRKSGCVIVSQPQMKFESGFKTIRSHSHSNLIIANHWGEPTFYKWKYNVISYCKCDGGRKTTKICTQKNKAVSYIGVNASYYICIFLFIFHWKRLKVAQISFNFTFISTSTIYNNKCKNNSHTYFFFIELALNSLKNFSFSFSFWLILQNIRCNFHLYELSSKKRCQLK